MDDAAVLFLKEEKDDDVFVEHFSVPSPAPRKSRSSVVGQRAIVVHEGKEPDDADTGEWRCSRDKGAQFECVHIRRAKEHLSILNSESPNRLNLAELEEPDSAKPVLLKKGQPVFLYVAPSS